jgi:hypothetical protein
MWELQLREKRVWDVQTEIISHLLSTVVPWEKVKESRESICVALFSYSHGVYSLSMMGNVEVK